MRIEDIKKEFSIFANYNKSYGQDLVYLDSASTSLTPDIVVAKLNEYYLNYKSNVDRGNSKIAKLAGEEFREAKVALAKYLHTDKDNLIWTSGSTEASNNLLEMIRESQFFDLQPGDEILTTILEHHSTLLPLQKLAKEKGLKIKFIDLDSYFDLDLRSLSELVTEKTKIVSISMVSNTLGTITNLAEVVSKIKKLNPNIFVISDLTSAFGHLPIDLEKLSPYLDAGYFSMHKAFGPTGVGVLYLKRDFSRILTPNKLGGGIVAKVARESFALRSDLDVHEAGTQNLGGIIASSAAVKFLEKYTDLILDHNQHLVGYFLSKIKEFNKQEIEHLEIKVFAAMEEKNIGTISLQILLKVAGINEEINPHKLEELLAEEHITLRAGYNCAEPLMTSLEAKSGLLRVSCQLYNTNQDLDKLLLTISKIKETDLA